MAEELALGERLRERGAVDGDEGPRGARRAAVDDPGGHLLARARLALEEHRETAPREADEEPKRGGARRVARDDVVAEVEGLGVGRRVGMRVGSAPRRSDEHHRDARRADTDDVTRREPRGALDGALVEPGLVAAAEVGERRDGAVEGQLGVVARGVGVLEAKLHLGAPPDAEALVGVDEDEASRGAGLLDDQANADGRGGRAALAHRLGGFVHRAGGTLPARSSPCPPRGAISVLGGYSAVLRRDTASRDARAASDARGARSVAR